MARAKKPSKKPAGKPVARYAGPFGVEQAERLLWRAGFGPADGQHAAQLAAKGMTAAVESLVSPPRKAVLSGPAPTDGKGRQLFPKDAWGHDHLWWLDRMVRTNQPLVERMTLVWHDWFATSTEGSQQNLNFNQNGLLRRHAMGNFRSLFRDITKDPAMLIWLSGTNNNRWNPNENYAREMMELFSLGAHAKAYTERDIREAARALTGFQARWSKSLGAHGFRLTRKYHDDRTKKIFGRRGRHDWKDAVDLCVAHPKHPQFFVAKLWGYFIASAPSPADVAALSRLYKRNRYEVRPVLRAILSHPAFYTGPRMVKPPAVLQAATIRATTKQVNLDAWAWLGRLSGQQLFFPPNVAGWDDSRWLDTGTFNGRFMNSSYTLDKLTLSDKDPKAKELPGDAAGLVEAARLSLGTVTLSGPGRAALERYAAGQLAQADKTWKVMPYRVIAFNGLRQLMLISSDFQLC